jgi:hypothetical protein
MTAKTQAGPPVPRSDDRTEPTKEELQERVETARESISQTVGEIRETVEDQYASVKATVSGILDWREGFRREPLVWSVGALSAGFALGYTLGLGKTRNRRRAASPALSAFAEGLIDELRGASGRLPLATLDPQLRAMLGFDLSDVIAEIGGVKAPPRRQARARKRRRSGPGRREKASPRRSTTGPRTA